jgi:hypothetical protein
LGSTQPVEILAKIFSILAKIERIIAKIYRRKGLAALRKHNGAFAVEPLPDKLQACSRMGEAMSGYRVDLWR